MADITEAIIHETDVDEQAAKLAESVCTGNERKSWLHKATLTIRPTEIIVQFQVKLRNQHGWYARNPITGKKVRIGTAYSDTSTAKFTGYMGSNCTIQAYTVTSANAIYQVLGAFATLMVNSGPLKLYLMSKVCPLLGANRTLALNDAVVNARAAFASEEKPSLEGITFDASDIPPLADEQYFNYDTEPCLQQFCDPSVAVIQCDIPVTLTEAGKVRIRETTYGVFVDAACTISVNVTRAEIPSWFQENYIRIPPQFLKCALQTNQEAIEIDFTIEPVVWIENGEAVRATINMDNVSGIPSYLGNRLENEVNNNDQLNQALVDFVNDSGILS